MYTVCKYIWLCPRLVNTKYAYIYNTQSALQLLNSHKLVSWSRQPLWGTRAVCHMTDRTQTDTWLIGHKLPRDWSDTNWHMTDRTQTVTWLIGHKLPHDWSDTNCHVTDRTQTVTWLIGHKLSHDWSDTSCHMTKSQLRTQPHTHTLSLSLSLQGPGATRKLSSSWPDTEMSLIDDYCK